MATKVAQHRHCAVCGKAIPESEEVCSEACREDRDARQRKQRLLTYVMYGIMAATVLLILVGGVL